MEFKTLDDQSFLQINMALASIAYDNTRKEIETNLKNVKLLTPYGFKLQWFSVGTANQMYVAAPIINAQGDLSPANFVCIRGTVLAFSETSWKDFLEDTEVALVEWPFTQDKTPQAAKIAQGSSDGLKEITTIGDTETGQLLLPYLQNLQPNMLFVNGHSLGGALATGLALHLQKQTYHMILPYTFATPTIGNKHFADYMNDQFAGMYFMRTVNSLDNLPKFWSVSGIESVMDSYTPNPACPEWIEVLLEAVKTVVQEEGYDYEHVHNDKGVVLNGDLNPGDSWLEEVKYQHSASTYLSLLGVVTHMVKAETACTQKEPVLAV